MDFSVRKAVAATFAYIAERWLLLLKAMWLPALFIAALQLYAAPSLFNGLAEMVRLGPNPAPEAATAAFSTLGGSLIWYLVAGFIFFPMLTVACLRHIIRGEEPQAPFYFNYGADETRIMASNFLFNLMVVIISVVGELIVGVLAAVFMLVGAGGAAKNLGALGVNAATAWFQVRMSTLFPAVLATRTLALGEAWASTRRDWLALAGFWIVIGLALAPVVLLLAGPVFLPFAADLGPVRQGDTAAAAALLQKIAAALSPPSPSFWYTGVLMYALSLIVNAVINIASAVAWRFLAAGREGRGA